MNLWKSFIEGLFRVQCRAIAYNVLDVHVKCHIRGICEISQTRFVRKHQLRSPIVFVNLGAMDAEVLECDVEFQAILPHIGNIILL